MKDASIDAALRALRSRFGATAFLVEDHWGADHRAIGVAAPSEPSRLVYISTFSKPPGQYDVTLELPPKLSDELPYESR